MVWTVTEKGRRMPVDADPVEDGQFVLIEHLGSADILAVHKSKADNYRGQHDGNLYMPHHATCPNVDQFRGGGR